METMTEEKPSIEARQLLPDPSHEAATPEARQAMRSLAGLRVSQFRWDALTWCVVSDPVIAAGMEAERMRAEAMARQAMMDSEPFTMRVTKRGKECLQAMQRTPRTPITLTEQWQVEALIGCMVKPVGSLYPAGVLTRVNDRTMIIGDMAYAWRCHKVELLALPERGSTVEWSPVGGIRVKVESDDRMDALRSAWRFDPDGTLGIARSSEVFGTRDEHNRIAERAAEDAIEKLMVRPCSRCNDTGILPGFGFGTSVDAIDRPCGCKPAKVEGPSEWAVKLRHAEQRHVTKIDLHRGSENVTVYAVRLNHSGQLWTEIETKYAKCLVRIRGEHSVDMALARLLCGLRDGTVKL